MNQEMQSFGQDQYASVKRAWYKRWWVIVIGIGILVIVMESTEESNKSVTQETNENSIKAVEYEIAQEKNISYLGCRRVGIKITVPDDSREEDVKQTMENIIEAKKTSWDDITVWAYKNSEKGSAIE